LDFFPFPLDFRTTVSFVVAATGAAAGGDLVDRVERVDLDISTPGKDSTYAIDVGWLPRRSNE
jgi:hypothetical protein